jgi:hypothetical protein
MTPATWVGCGVGRDLLLCSAGDTGGHDGSEATERLVAPRRCVMTAAVHPRRLLAVRLAFAALLSAHSAAHFVAVVATVRSLVLDLPLDLLGGLVVTSSWAVAMLLGVALAAAGTGFAAAACMVVGREPTVGPFLAAVAVLSLTTTVVASWATVGGVLVNVAVLAASPAASELVAVPRRGTF